MKRILLIGREYYPNNSPGSHRLHSMARHLPAFGYEPTILCLDWTPTNCARSFNRKAYDRGLEGRDVCRTIRVPYVLPRESAWQDFKNLAWPLWGSSAGALFTRGRELVAAERFDVLLGTSPVSLALSAASRLARIARTPWVADLRDVAGQDRFELHWSRPWRLRQLALRAAGIARETAVCRSALCVTTVSDFLASKLGGRGLPNVHVIMNGFEPDDYRLPVPGKSAVFRLVYTGTLAYGRDPTPVFDALDLLVGEGTIQPSDFQACFYSQSADALQRHLTDRACRAVVHVSGYQSRAAILETTAAASLLLQLSHGKERGIATSKLFEYLGAGRPILAVPDDGDVVSMILRATGAGRSASGAREVADIIADHFRQWKAHGAAEYRGNPEAVACFTRKAQIERLAAVLDSTLERLRDS